jgi:chorismate dehydratase
MTTAHHNASTPTAAAVRRIGCVSYLNAKPLIEGVESIPNTRVKLDVPSRLLEDLQSGEVDIALCPVIDFFRSTTPLEIVPAGGIGCDGPTLTVRLFSRVPIKDISTIHADTDSHTSVALLRVLLRETYNMTPTLIDYHAREGVARHKLAPSPEAMLLIGDKVVTDSPTAIEYPHQLDLGEAWRELTGLPFVFAVWMTTEGAMLGDLPRRLDEQRLRNAARIEEIVDRHAAAHGWPRDLALQYLGRLLRYAIGPREREAVERFGALAAKCGVIDAGRPLRLHGK